MSIINIAPKKQDEITYKPGKYEAVIQASEMTVSKSGMDMLKVTFKGDFGKSAPRTITDYIVNNGFGQKKFYKLLEALSLLGKGEVDTDDIQGKYVGIEIVEGEPHKDKKSWNVSRYFALDEDDSSDDIDDEDFDFE